jgi:hypothetical protein
VNEQAMIIGYARVGTDGQRLDAGAERVFAEKISGAVADRKALARASLPLALATLLVTLLDRLARSITDLLNTLDAIGKAGPFPPSNPKGPGNYVRVEYRRVTQSTASQRSRQRRP